jgi:DNA/RNA endonuclease YhcR with UshA esterase domain
MKLIPRSLLAATLAACFLAPTGSFAAEKSKPKVVNASDKKSLAAKIGKEVTVEGQVVRVAKGPNDGVRLLEFSEKEGAGFVAAIFPVAYKNVGPIKDYKGKTVRVTGTLEKYRKQTQIKILKASQLKILAAPPTPKKK